MTPNNDSLREALALIQEAFDEKDQEIQALKEENLILQKEYNRVCQMLSVKEEQKSKDKGFLSRFFPGKEGEDLDVIEVPKEKTPRDLVLESFEDLDQTTWPLQLISYMKEDPSPEDLLDLLEDYFPKDSPKDLTILLDLLDEDLLLDLFKRRPDFTLLVQRKNLSFPSLFKLLRIYYKGRDFFMVDHLLNRLHDLSLSMTSRDLKIYYLISLTRPIPLSDRAKKQVENLLDQDPDFRPLALAFVHKKDQDLTHHLAQAFADPKDRDLAALAFTLLK